MVLASRAIKATTLEQLVEVWPGRHGPEMPGASQLHIEGPGSLLGHYPWVSLVQFWEVPQVQGHSPESIHRGTALPQS